MDSLDIQIVDSLTVNLNQEEYSTEGQVLNTIDVYVEDEQLLFEAALTQDSINLYTRETPDIISFDTKGIMDGISKLESLIEKTSKEATLLAKVAELKEALNSIDFTAIEQAIQGVEDVTAKETTLIQGIGDIIKAVENIDFTDLENSIAEVKNAVANIDFSALAKETTLTQVQSKVEEVGNKIDNIKLPEIDTTELAKEATLNEVSSKLDNLNVEVDLSGVAQESTLQEVKQAVENIELPEIDTSAIAQQATLEEVSTKVTNLEALITNSVLKEVVTIILNCQDSVEWSEYAVEVTMANGSVQYVPITENGTCVFSVPIGQEYSVQLPVFGAYIAPQVKTYTAMTIGREIYWSYVVSGVFGLDEVGRRYSVEQIEALQDKSIIKYGAYTDEYLENIQKADGTYGCGFMWKLGEEYSSGLAWSSANVEFSQELLPFLTKHNDAKLYCDGEAYTSYIISEGIRLGVTTPAARWCLSQTIKVKGIDIKGFLMTNYQYSSLFANRTLVNSLYSACELTAPSIPHASRDILFSHQYSESECVTNYTTITFFHREKRWSSAVVFLVFPLPK